MSVRYKDYYKTLGVSRTASQEEIAKSFKKLARKYHPDLNPDDASAETKFKEINEAYEVLKDPDKRRKYDHLGPEWEHGQNFQPPPGFENVRFHFGGGGGPGGGGFSDFFETIFGQAGGGGFQGGQFGGGQFGGFQGGGFGARPRRGEDIETELSLSLEEAFTGGEKTIALKEQEPGMPPQTKNLKVNIPAGVRDGAKIRLSGQGGPGYGGGTAGDLYLKVRVLPHARFKLDDNDVCIDLNLAPWEAVFGGTFRVPTLSGEVELNVPAGVDSGQKLRLRGKGLGSGAKRGDQLVRIMIKTPKDLNFEERHLWKSLADSSEFKARNE